jgi:hypothetical protein
MSWRRLLYAALKAAFVLEGSGNPGSAWAHIFFPWQILAGRAAVFARVPISLFQLSKRNIRS